MRFLLRWACRALAVGAVAGGLVGATTPALAQQGKREVALPQPGRLGGIGVPVGAAPTLFGADPSARAWEQLITTFDAEYRAFRPRPETPPDVTALYANEFDGLRHLELKGGVADTVSYAVNLDMVYTLRRGTSGQFEVREIARLPIPCNALCKGPNGDLYLTSTDPRDSRTLYRFDPRARRLFRSNLALPLLHDAQDQWLSAAAWGDCLYLLNDVGTNLVELAPGRAPRNLLAGALRAPQVPGFVGKVMNMTVGPDRTFYLKENFTPTLWTFTEKAGRLTVAAPLNLAFAGVTGGIEVVPARRGAPANARPTLLFAEVNRLDSRLVTYDLATDRAEVVAPVKCTDLSLTPAHPAEAPWPRATTWRGWFSGALYVDFAEQPAIALHFAPAGRLDSVAFGGRRWAIGWHFRQRGEALEFSADPAFADYVRWFGGGRHTGTGATEKYTMALQSSFFDALNELLGADGPVPFAFSAGTEGFALLKPGPLPKPVVAQVPVVPPAVEAPAEPPVTVVEPSPVQPDIRPETRPVPPPKPPTPRVSDSLFCTGAEIVVEATDYNIVDGDQVQFFLDDRPLTGVITLRKKPRRFTLPCPENGGLLIMRTINAGQGPCTARLVIRQDGFKKTLKLESTVKRPSALKFFRRPPR